MGVKKAALFKKIKIFGFLSNKTCEFLIPLYLILFASLIAGCTATPQPRIYHLGISEPPLIQKNEKKELLIIETTSLPRHLDRPQIISRNSDNEIIIHEQERWAASLDRLFRESLAARLDPGLEGIRVIPVDISGSYAGTDKRIRIQILDFSSDIKGMVRLSGIFNFTGKTVSYKEVAFNFKIIAENNSQSAVIAAHSTAMDMLTEKIISQILP